MLSLVRSTFFIPQSVMITFFSVSIPAISHLLVLGHIPENLEELSMTLNTTSTELMSFF